MIVEAWHFLVSRNRHLDYRTVVAPDFICQSKISNLLARVAEGDLTESKRGLIRQITGSKAGDFTIVFRVIKATEKCLNPEKENDILKDQFGREIYLIEGVVIKGIRNKKDCFVADQDIEEAHNLLMEAYRQFWEYSEPNSAISSHKFSLSMNNTSSYLQLEELEPFHFSSKQQTPPTTKPKVNLVAFLVPIIVILIIAIWLTTIGYPFGKSIADGCTTIQEVNILFKSEDKINSIIDDKRKQWQQEYPKAQIFLNGSLKVQNLKKWKFLNEREQLVNKKTQYTLLLNKDNSLQMQYHPLDLAITQLRNQKVVDETTIQAKIINQKECIPRPS
ncbi:MULTISPECIES: hypothetical protein [Nostocales]|jgi:hypothetical protein|uniref:hypothetical protein n=1 Tax=Nostocales TaxID=1161 RepID=UPI0002F7B6A3|nr:MULTISPECIES: hypothetical protein [Nostocales]MTJ16324.1 hypothetical protein [Dolichospermum sp. UHCC 0299]MTJ38708.1 hypothetical protein [Dolichospermum sp. UHCC 0406]